MKLGITNGLEYCDLQSEIDRQKSMNGLRRCKAHANLTEYVPCAQCAREGKTGEYQDFLFKKEEKKMSLVSHICDELLELLLELTQQEINIIHVEIHRITERDREGIEGEEK